MTILLWCWCVFLGLTALIWAGRLRQVIFARRTLPPLTPKSPPAQGDFPRISVLVAAKDEEENIETCLRSLLNQEYPSLQIVAANDRSADRTGMIMDDLAREDARLRVLHIQELQAGWFGKCNALREADVVADGDWLCFTDADCNFVCPQALSIAIKYARETGAEFLSILPEHRAHGFWEKLLQPAFSGIMMLWFNPVDVNNPRKKAAYANGAFMLMSRPTYDALGGHAAVKSQINEDMYFARIAKDKGCRLRIIPNEDLYTVRMYESFSEIWTGWTRIFAGSFASLKRVLITFFVVLFFTLLPWATLVVATAAATSRSHSAWSVLQWFALAACVLQTAVMVGFYRLNRVYPLFGLLYPVAALIGSAILINSAKRVGGRGKIVWKGTTYCGEQVVQPARAS